MLRKKYENFFFFAASRVRSFLTPGQTETNNFFFLDPKYYTYTVYYKIYANL